jgi:hypothetical protein
MKNPAFMCTFHALLARLGIGNDLWGLPVEYA